MIFFCEQAPGMQHMFGVMFRIYLYGQGKHPRNLLKSFCCIIKVWEVYFAFVRKVLAFLGTYK